MDTPQWYIELVELSPLIESQNWDAVHSKAKELSKILYINAPTVQYSFENIVLATMSPEVAPAAEQEIKKAYAASMVAADKELATSDYDRIIAEERLADRLDIISEHISSSLRIIWNYWWGENSGDYKEWHEIKTEIETTPLTYQGRLRLLARHETIGSRILPSFAKMVIQLWPIAAIWVIKKVGTILLSSTISKTLETRKTKKQLKSAQSKLQGFNLSVSSLKKPKRK